jgi:hypothetical protein
LFAQDCIVAPWSTAGILLCISFSLARRSVQK